MGQKGRGAEKNIAQFKKKHCRKEDGEIVRVIELNVSLLWDCVSKKNVRSYPDPWSLTNMMAMWTWTKPIGTLMWMEKAHGASTLDQKPQATNACRGEEIIFLREEHTDWFSKHQMISPLNVHTNNIIGPRGRKGGSNEHHKHCL